MGKSIDDLSKEVAEFKDSLLKKTEELKYQVPNPKKEEAKEKPFVETTAKDVGSELKRHLINDDPMITTENFIRSFFAEALKQVKEIHTEATKNPWTEFLEATPLGAFAPALEKWFESREDKEVQWWHWLLAAVVGGTLLVLLPAIKGWLVNFSRDLQTYERGGDNSAAARSLRPIRSKNADGGWSRQIRGDVEAREKRQWEGASGIADIPANANFDNLRNQLDQLNPHLQRFNQRAPVFSSELGKMPKAGVVEKTAKAVAKVNDAITAAVPTKMGAVASKLVALAEAVEKYKEHDPDSKKLGQINKVVGKSNPTKIEELAKATGKLAGAQRHFDPDKLPNVGNLRTAARAANELAEAGGNVTTAFNNFRLAVQRADDTL
ncbi:hypothetical protein [Streptomyces sp. NPDC048266]|uniref:hypothetical protein n=1 Tax=unclassified Streptomyces TaxID=2593676 RepID=UPI00340FF77A